MDETTLRVLHWAPRALGILLALFVSLFALDAFGGGEGFWKSLAGFLIHLLPPGLIVAALLAGWRWPWLGGVLFLALAAFYVALTGGRAHWLSYLLLAGPAVAIGVLFLLDSFLQRAPAP